MRFEDLSDEELVGRIQEIKKRNPLDDSMRQLFDVVYLRYYQRAYNLARFYGLDRFEAEDAVQDAFFKLLVHVDQFRRDLNFSVWFMRIVFNAVKDKFRDKKRHSYSDIEEIAETVSEEKQNFFEKFHFQDNLQRIINRLPEKIRMVVILRVFGEMEFEQIAKLLQISVRQVHNRMNQAIDLLKKYGKEG